MCCITGLVPAQHACFLCPATQASKPIMALRRFLPPDTSMARSTCGTDAGGLRSDVAGDRMLRHPAKAMASSRPTSTSAQPPMPETDRPTPSIGPSDAPKIALPKNLAQTLQFLSDDDLETLRASVEIELERRRPISAGPITRKASAVQPPKGARTSRGPERGARFSDCCSCGKGEPDQGLVPCRHEAGCDCAHSSCVSVRCKRGLEYRAQDETIGLDLVYLCSALSNQPYV